jgi:hypothetical protein
MAWYSGITSGISNYFSSGSGWSDIFKGILGGVSNYAGQQQATYNDKLDFNQNKELIGLQNLEARRNSRFEQQLKDYAQDRDTYKNRVALDTYGQFSNVKSYAPNYVPPAAPTAPVLPTP